MKTVVIVGGGIAGLAAAFHLQEKARAGAPVRYVLLEREPRLGGKILTERVDGFLLDGGPDCFVSEKPGVFELAARLGIEHRLLPSNEEHKGTFVLSGGRLHRLPEGLMLMVPTRILPFLASPLISWPGKLRMAMDLFLPPRRDDADESLASFVTRRLGREALEKIAEPLVSGIHGAAAPEEMSVRASFPRFIKMEQEHGSLIRAMLAARRKTPPGDAGGAGRGSMGAGGAGASAAGAGGAPAPPSPGSRRTFFMSFVGGMGELVEAVTARLDPAAILTGHPVTAIEERTGNGEGTGARPGAGGGHPPFAVHVEGRAPIEADAVIVAAPSADAARLLEAIDGEMTANLAGIRLASTAVVCVAYLREDVPHPLEGFGFIVPAVEHRRIMGVTYSSIKWDGRTPDDRTVLLRVFIGGARNHDLIRSGEAEILSAVRQELRDILGIAATPVLARVYRWLDAMHQYTLGHLDRVAAIEAALGRHPGLCLAGGAYRGVGVGECIRSGFAAAERALGPVSLARQGRAVAAG